jgi:exodeoxyribonuclease-3
MKREKHMRIITWNCNMAFRKKAGHILSYKPDIVVVPECEHPDKLKFNSGTEVPSDCFWFGENRNKGLGVFSYSRYKFKLIDNHNTNLKTILPLSVSNGKNSFNLFAIWANNPKDPDGHYVTQIWKAIHHYDQLLRDKRTILAGDFNSNTIWDRPKREGNHSTVVARLEARNIYSMYHKFYNQTQGRELHPTWFLYRHRDKPYHLDYCFASADFAGKLIDVQIGTHKDWCAHSDHTPLIVTFAI